MNIHLYQSIPYVDGGRTLAGCDCWGLVRLVLNTDFNVLYLPSFGRVSAGQYDAMDTAFKDGVEDFKQVQEPQAGDVACCFNQSGKMAHVAVVIHGDRGLTALETTSKYGVRTMQLAAFVKLYHNPVKPVEFYRYA
jgi:cell wall-associated NlpC family hydrolase